MRIDPPDHLTDDLLDDLPDTPVSDIKPARGRFHQGSVAPLLQSFYPARQIDVMREHGVDQRMMFGINPYYMALVQGHELSDATGTLQLPAMPPSRALHALVVPILAEAADVSGEKDPSNQIRYSPDTLKGKLLHKYDEIVLGYSALACSAHCRYCYRLDIFNGSTGKGLVKPEELKAYVVEFNRRFRGAAAHGDEGRYPIREVLLSGGDPMVLSNRNLYRYMAAAADAGVHLVRIGTKEMAFRPQRFDANLAFMLQHFHRRYPDVHVNLVVHFTHADEMLQRDATGAYMRNELGYYRWLPAVRRALDLVQGLPFVTLENQTPIIARVNDDALALRILQEELRRNGIKPKYLFQCREIEGHTAFAVPVERAWALHNDAQRGVSDTARSRFTMSTEWGKLEVVSVIDGPPAHRRPILQDGVDRLFGDGLVVMKVHRSPASASSQGDLVIARRNRMALWISDYEDRIVYDGRLSSDHKYMPTHHDRGARLGI